jgi:hypothetical protein
MKGAQKPDWANEPMPISSKFLVIDAVFTPEEFQSITLGCIPNGMDERWFMYYDEPWFYMHRSWTGYCIYKVRFEECATGFKIVEVIANRDPSQYIVADDALDASLLQEILDDIKLYNVGK